MLFADNALKSKSYKMKKSFYLSGLLFVSSILLSLTANATVPTVYSHPANDTVCAPGHALFIIAAIDTPGPTPITYSWQVSTDGGTVWTTITDTTFYSGTANDTLDVTGMTMLSGYMYRGIATNTSGADTSNGAWLTVDTAYAGAITGPMSVCRGSTMTLFSSVSGGTWTSSNPSVATVGSSSGIVSGVPSAYAYDSIHYSITNQCGVSTSSVEIHVDSFVYAAPITGTSLTCVGNFITLSNANTIGTRMWSSSNTLVATISTTGVVTGAGYGGSTIAYSFTTACNSVTSFFGVWVDTVMTPATITGPSTLCAGSSITLSASAGGGGWISSSSSIAIAAGTTVTGVSEGTAMISYITANGCGAAIATHPVTVSVSASAISGLDSVGVGLTRLLTNSASGGTWTISDTSIATIDSAGLVTGVAAGTATVTYTVTNACGTSSATLLMHVGPAPSAGAIIGADSVCIGATLTLTNTSAPGGVWSIHPSDTISASRASISAGGVVTGIAFGPANISYTFTNGFGATTLVKTVFVNRPPVVSVTGPVTSTRLGENYLIKGFPAGGTWTSSNSAVALLIATMITYDTDSLRFVSNGSVIVMGPGSSTISYRVTNTCGTTTGTYVLTYTTVNGVNSITKNAGAINIFPNPNNGEFNFNLVSDNEEPANVIITNVLGEKVKELTVTTNKANHMIFDAPAGMYLLTATTAHGTYSGKVTISK